MKISISYKHLEMREPVEIEMKRYLSKLAKLLKRYSPDLVQLHGSLEKRPRKAEYIFSLNLSLPTGSLYATGDRKSTRLNSSHGSISYAVFCLKKKKKQLSFERVSIYQISYTHMTT